MPECEICGKRVETVYEVMFDGAQMLVCEKDVRGRQIVNTFGPGNRSSRSAMPREAAQAPEELIEHYGEAIRKAREAMGLPVRVLAERINEKESTLDRIEKEKTLPGEKTRIKLEKELGIKLLARAPDAKSFVASKKNEPTTLWDLAKKDEKDEQQT